MKHIKIPVKHKEIMLTHAFSELPNECCGVLTGTGSTAKRIVRMKSDPASPDAYFMDPEQQVAVFSKMQERGESLIGIYHSHPDGPDYPSGSDLQFAFHPESAYIILSLKDRQAPVIRAFILKDRQFKEIDILWT